MALTDVRGQDNGAKLVDPRGEMLEASWEAHATSLANAATTTELLKALATIVTTCKIDLSKSASVVFGRDTRPSGVPLTTALARGIEALGGKATDVGVVTTPCLHYIVRTLNTSSSDEPTEQGYYQKMVDAYKSLMRRASSEPTALLVDCANGVGALAASKLAPLISLPLTLVCTSTDSPKSLNSNCGADYVKTQQKAPPAVTLEVGQRACSLDGDADRVVYYYSAPGDRFKLLDGDKIATLAASFIGDLVKQANLSDKLKIGVVQTAYANGNSTQYLRAAGLPVRCTPTGVKYLHHAAEKFDIGVYFEANGHGTVLFSPETLHLLETHEAKTPAQDDARQYLVALTSLINQAVGDALSDMLLVEVILAHRGWGPEEWDQGYEDLPNRLVKVNVRDRSAFVTEDAERRLISPPGLQERVDEKVRKFEKGRSFVRPSGTEDCVRVYAEASTKVGAADLAMQVSQLVSEFQ